MERSARRLADESIAERAPSSEQIPQNAVADPRQGERILFVSLGAVIGGAEIYLEGLVEFLHDRRNCFAVCGHPELVRRLAASGVHVDALPPRWGLKRAGKYIAGFFAGLRSALRHRVSAVHLNGYQAAYLTLPFRLIGRSVVLTPHHLPESAIVRRWYALHARWASTIVCVSEAAAREHKSLLPRKNVTVIPNWTRSRTAVSMPNVRPTMKTVLFIGRMVDAKGLPVLMNALAQSAPSLELLAIGTGPDKAKFEVMAQAKGIKARFLGFVPEDELFDHYRSADLLVAPSLGPEGSCLVALEAMANGIPCLMSDLAVYREIAEQGATAALFRRGDADSLAGRLDWLAIHPEIRSALAERALDMVRKKYSAQNAARRYQAVL